MPTVLATGMFVSVKPKYAHHEAAVWLEFVIAKLQRGPVSISPIAFVRVQREPVGPRELILRAGIGAGPDERIQQRANTTAMKTSGARFMQPRRSGVNFTLTTLPLAKSFDAIQHRESYQCQQRRKVERPC